MKRKPKRSTEMTIEQTKRLKKVLAVLRGDYGQEARHALYDFIVGWSAEKGGSKENRPRG